MWTSLTYDNIHHPEKYLHHSSQGRALVQGPPALSLVVDEGEDEGDVVVADDQFPFPPPVHVAVQDEVPVDVNMITDTLVVEETVKLVNTVEVVRLHHGDVVLLPRDLVDDGDQGGEVVRDVEETSEVRVRREKSRSVDEAGRPHSSLVGRGLPAPPGIIPGPGVWNSSVVVRVENHCVLQLPGQPEDLGDVSEALVYAGHQATAPASGGVGDVTAELLVMGGGQQRVVGSQVGEEQEERR